MNAIRPILVFLVLAFIISGCPPTKETRKEEPPPKPIVKKPAPAGFEVTVASVNLSKLSKRIERPDIEQFAELIRKAKIDILTMEGLSRYPGIESRVDIVNELGRGAEMYHVFGETINLSGRQGGNAIFSIYPIRSNENSHYDRIASNNFEAALQAVIDCGIRDILIVSTLLPEKASTGDLNICADRLSGLTISYINTPLIIGGNLPTSDIIRSLARFDATRPARESDAPSMWFSNDGSLKLLHQEVVRSVLGNVAVARFSIAEKLRP